MKLKTALVLFAILLRTSPSFAEPPKILSTSPSFWAVNVSPANQKNVTIVFDQPLRPGFWDWFGRDVLSPPSSLATILSSDRLTCTVDVKLEPGRVYICALNEKGIPGVGFQNDKGKSLKPTYLVFQTAGNPVADDAPPRVISTIPRNAQQVDSSRVKSVSITFDRAMAIAKHGLHMTENKNPVDLTKARFQYSPDGKTFGLVYDFKPASTYEFELNSTTDIGFSSAKRVPLWPARFAFTTAPAQ